MAVGIAHAAPVTGLSASHRRPSLAPARPSQRLTQPRNSTLASRRLRFPRAARLTTVMAAGAPPPDHFRRLFSLFSAAPCAQSERRAPVLPHAELIDGKAIAETIRAELKVEVDALRARYGAAPGLAVVLVGQRKDSQTYVRNKKKACEEVGIVSFGTDLPEDAGEAEVLAVVAAYNADPAVHGILVQLPLPKGIDEQRILDAISIDKDVDGFHPLNIGALAMRGRTPLFVPCTPKGCIELLRRSGVAMAGKKAAVVGRSNIVGMPAALLLQREDATVTVIHSRTPDAARICADADIIVAACGRAEMVRGDWVKPGAAVIDVGINAVDVSRLSPHPLLLPLPGIPPARTAC